MNAIVYTRFSPRPNAAECESITTQLERCSAYCTAQGYISAAQYQDAGISGATQDERPGLQSAIEHVCRIKGILVVYSLDRLARNTRDALEISERLQAAGAELAVITQSINTHTPAGRFFFTLLAALAALERETICERTSVAMKAHQRRGRRMSRYAPFGYRVVGDRLEPEPEEQEVVRQMLEWYERGGYALCQRALRARGIYRRGDRWSLARIKSVIDRERILKREV